MLDLDPASYLNPPMFKTPARTPLSNDLSTDSDTKNLKGLMGHQVLLKKTKSACHAGKKKDNAFYSIIFD